MSQVSQTEIEAWFKTLRDMADEVAGSDMPAAEREKVKVLARMGLFILESVVVDLNAIAWQLGSLVDLERNRR